MNKFTVIVLAAGSGSRMQSETPKQYMLLDGKPIMMHCLLTFEQSRINDIVLVVTPGDEDKCEKLIKDYNITKVKAIVAGGQERYDSVYAGLSAVDSGYVLIHDSARAFIDIETIHRCMNAVMLYDSCVVGMPTKDTVKLVDDKRKVTKTPDRENVWIVQTPQCFEYSLIKKAYDNYYKKGGMGATDDAMVVENYTKHPVHMIKATYNNIKITTPEDIAVGEALLKFTKK